LPPGGEIGKPFNNSVNVTVILPRDRDANSSVGYILHLDSLDSEFPSSFNEVIQMPDEFDTEKIRKRYCR